MTSHIPVLLNEILDEFSSLDDGAIFIDGTLGAGGHSLAIAEKNNSNKKKIQILGIDKDESALKIAQKRFEAGGIAEQLIAVNDDYKNIATILSGKDIEQVDGVLIDMGVSSMQLDDKSRGFSFADPAAPIDMRMNQDQKFCAADVVNHYGEARLADLIFHYGDERFSRQIARNIVKNRPIKNMGELIEAIKVAMPAKARFAGTKHFATRTLQALRIEVNNELIGVERVIDDVIEILKSGAKLAIITFHSLEDKIVKDKFRELAKDCICPPRAPICICKHQAAIKMITKKPIVPSEQEILANPRSRSAKLRIIEKI
ncbi:MAG: 16S rRNA (cytosine(1402)-N(4))-methyltransferase RsmH [Candidatus Berkelbacteria bacterium]